jgi:hypothetical protein
VHQLHAHDFVDNDGKDIVMPKGLENEHMRAARPKPESGALL